MKKKTTKTKYEIRARRCFSEEFKIAKVKELVEKRITVLELSRIYGVTRSAVYKWLYRYSPHHEKGITLVVEMESESFKTKQLQQQVAELERIIGKKQLQIDFLEKLFEVGSEELGFDLKKNFSTKLSNGIDGAKKNTATE